RSLRPGPRQLVPRVRRLVGDRELSTQSRRVVAGADVADAAEVGFADARRARRIAGQGGPPDAGTRAIARVGRRAGVVVVAERAGGHAGAVARAPAAAVGGAIVAVLARGGVAHALADAAGVADVVGAHGRVGQAPRSRGLELTRRGIAAVTRGRVVTLLGGVQDAVAAPAAGDGARDGERP